MGYAKNVEVAEELFFANGVLSVIENVEVPMLIYEGEKEIVKKALRKYIDELKEKAGLDY